MNWLADTLRRIGVLPAFTVDEILNAENEDSLVDHRKVLNELTDAISMRRLVTSRLRETLKEVSQRTHNIFPLDH